MSNQLPQTRSQPPTLPFRHTDPPPLLFPSAPSHPSASFLPFSSSPPTLPPSLAPSPPKPTYSSSTFAFPFLLHPPKDAPEAHLTCMYPSQRMLACAPVQQPFSR
ncbi:unnamed protein product [Closterium sp. NIES-64]|nr:unnamed protein product [Closterium sp. NIES-64]